MPNIILRKLIGSVLIGIGCAIVGTVSCIAYGDYKMLMLSLIIFLGMGVKVFFTCKRFRDGKFIAITGICSKISRKLFSRYKTIEIETEDETFQLCLPKDIKLTLNEAYTFYFTEKPSEVTPVINHYLTSRLNMNHFLGCEKAEEVQEKNTASNS